MKFKVREGFVCHLTTRVEVGGGQSELQQTLAYPGQTIDLSAAQAGLHAHQLEPMDDDARAWHDERVFVAPEPPASSMTGVSAVELQALVQRVTEEVTQRLQREQPQKPAPSART